MLDYLTSILSLILTIFPDFFYFIYEKFYLGRFPNICNIYISKKNFNGNVRTNLKKILKNEKIILRCSRTKSITCTIHRLHIQTNHSDCTFISKLFGQLADFNKTLKNEEKIKEYIIYENIAMKQIKKKDTENDHSLYELNYFNKTMEHLEKQQIGDDNSLDENHFILFWHGTRVHIPMYNNGKIRLLPQKMNFLIPDFLDSHYSTISILGGDDYNKIFKKYSGLVDLQEKIIFIGKKITQKLIEGQIIKEEKGCRISLFYEHIYFDSICDKALVPYFAYDFEHENKFNYWNTDDLSEHRTLYKRKSLHIGSCFSDAKSLIKVYVLSNKTIEKSSIRKDYFQSWENCYDEDIEEHKEILKKHKTRSQVHTGIRIHKEGYTPFVLCYDIAKLPIVYIEDIIEWQKDKQKAIEGILNEEYENINCILNSFCEKLFCHMV